ncbi:MAG: MBL fold metallo-hydrolase [Candidatus Odinarchaeota archaeon]
MIDEISFELCNVSMIGGSTKSSPRDCCVYLVVSSDFAILIDTGTGTAESMRRIMSNLRNKTSTESVKYIVVTHGHIDHAGGVEGLSRELPEAEIVAHEHTAKVIEQGDRVLSAASWYDLPLNSARVGITISREFIIRNREELTFLIIPTPGHTPGSVVGVLECRDGKVLFGQDIHGPFMPEWGSDIALWRESMQLLLNLKADYLCEGHYGIIKGKSKVNAFINRYLEQHRR